MKLRPIIIANEQDTIHQFGLDVIKFFSENSTTPVISSVDLGYDFAAIALNTFEYPVLFNPKIVYEDEEETVMDEFFPEREGIFSCKIKRPKSIRVRAVNHMGVGKTQFFTGLTARVIMHEIDRFNGVDIEKKANKYHLDQAYKRYSKYNKGKK